jgi:hypothetical protein
VRERLGDRAVVLEREDFEQLPRKGSSAVLPAARSTVRSRPFGVRLRALAAGTLSRRCGLRVGLRELRMSSVDVTGNVQQGRTRGREACRYLNALVTTELTRRQTTSLPPNVRPTDGAYGHASHFREFLGTVV